MLGCHVETIRHQLLISRTYHYVSFSRFLVSHTILLNLVSHKTHLNSRLSRTPQHGNSAARQHEPLRALNMEHGLDTLQRHPLLNGVFCAGHPRLQLTAPPYEIQSEPVWTKPPGSMTLPWAQSQRGVLGLRLCIGASMSMFAQKRRGQAVA